MLDFGFVELLMIIAIAVFVIGPQDIPKVMLGLGRLVRRLQYVRYAFTQQFDEFLRQSDLADIRQQVNFEAKEFDESAADEDVMQPLPEPHAPHIDDKDGQSEKGEQKND